MRTITLVLGKHLSGINSDNGDNCICRSDFKFNSVIIGRKKKKKKKKERGLRTDTHIQAVCSGFTGAAQYGLHLFFTHKPFRAATASPELKSWSLRFHLFCYLHSLPLPVLNHAYTDEHKTYSLSFIYLKEVQMVRVFCRLKSPVHSKSRHGSSPSETHKHTHRHTQYILIQF